ncbi:MAG: hypothetical protein LUF00_04765 [Lachnospiraceae bacterium]|nr:hypothetical protein [Lachnospiraceae bacterium]
MNDHNLHFEKSVCGVTLLCDLIPMGRDVTLCIHSVPGGHVGSAALAVARPSLTGQGQSATTSVLNCIGHKDDAVAVHLAEAIGTATGCTTVCVCGIHIDGLSPEGIQAVLAACREMEAEILRVLAQPAD